MFPLTVLKSLHVHQPRLSGPSAFGFLWRLHYDCLHHWWLSIQLSLNPLSPPRGLSVGQESKVKLLVAQLCPTLRPHGLCQARLSMEFSTQVYWSGLSFPSPGNLPNPGLEAASPVSPALEGWFFNIWATRKPQVWDGKFQPFNHVVCSTGNQHRH